ncbi:hypothetical protein FQA39_LY12961 [Lamprigera yunnana]|nr:hypothetical protein FQA39_LY12961 [Lamprigera yunnana]
MFYKAVSDIPDFASRTGDQYAMSALISHIDNTKGINFESFELLGLNLGQYQSGKFGFMMLGLPMAAAAMMLNVPKENRKNVMGIYLSAAFTCFLTGFMGTHVSMTVSGGFIDYIVFGLVPYLNGAMDAMSAFGILIVTAAMGPIYFIAFYLAVKYGKVMVPGRDGAANAQLATKADYKELKASGTQVSATTDNKEAARMQKAAGIIKFLGGAENIENVDACASRLRVNVKDASKVDKNGIMSLGGSTVF